MPYCLYYQAHVNKSQTWYFVAILRSYEHTCFDRTLNKSEGIFEFFVPKDAEPQFLEIMSFFANNNIIKNLIKLDNRVELGEKL